MPMHEHTLWIGEFEFRLSPAKVLWWPQGETLIVSDLHLGKAAHFRKEGVYLPDNAGTGDLLKLQQLVHYYEAKKIWILGDFFHSEYNAAWKEVVDWRKHHPQLEVVLIKGNHDLLHPEYYEQVNIEVLPQLVLGDILFCHEPQTLDDLYTISGHIHPGIRMEMKARQSITLPCFYRHRNQLLMPAFGALTGLHSIEPAKGSEVFALAPNEVLRIAY